MGELVVVWTSGDREVAIEMVFMYVLNAKRNKWWENITMIVWGPSAPLLAKDEELQVRMTQLIEAGVMVKACRSSSDHYGVSSDLEKLGILVKNMGVDFTADLKGPDRVITF